MSNDDHWLDKRKTKDSAFNRRMDDVRSTQVKLAAMQKPQRDWSSGVFSAHTMSDNQASAPASAYRPDHSLPSNYKSGQFAAREAEPKSPQPLSSSYDSGHFAKLETSYDPRHFAQPEPGYNSEQNAALSAPAYNTAAAAPSQPAFDTAQPSIPFVPEVAVMSNQEIDARAFFDPQTQAYNFRYIVRRMEHELARAKYFDRTVSILVISIDTIKIIPAECGQGPVDKSLDSVALTLFNNVRPIDLIGRYTDDRFVVVCPEISVEEVALLAEKILHACANIVVKHQWQDFKLSVSIGIAVSSPEFDDVESLIAIADLGTDMITQSGGNGVCFGTDAL